MGKALIFATSNHHTHLNPDGMSSHCTKLNSSNANKCLHMCSFLTWSGHWQLGKSPTSDTSYTLSVCEDLTLKGKRNINVFGTINVCFKMKVKISNILPYKVSRCCIPGSCLEKTLAWPYLHTSLPRLCSAASFPTSILEF